MSKPLVDSSANGVDRARLCLTLRSRRFLTHALPQTRAYRPRQQTPERCRRPIPPPHLRSAPSAAVQIPIALSSADHRGNPRGFLLWGLSNACPPTSAVHPSPPLRAGIGQPLPESELPLRLKKDSSGLLRTANCSRLGLASILDQSASVQSEQVPVLVLFDAAPDAGSVRSQSRHMRPAVLSC
jgi:hypothetical protein